MDETKSSRIEWDIRGAAPEATVWPKDDLERLALQAAGIDHEFVDGLDLGNPSHRFVADARAVAYRALLYEVLSELSEIVDRDEFAVRMMVIKKRVAHKIRKAPLQKADAAAENAEDIVDDVIRDARSRP